MAGNSALSETATGAGPQAGGQPAIRLDHVSKYFFTKGKRIKAVDDVHLDIPSGAFISLVGPSGSGKTTLFNMIAGFTQPERGAVYHHGRKILGPNIGIGYMTQKDALMPWRNVLANVMLPLQLQHVPDREARSRARDMIERVGLGGFAQHLPHELSGGMLKRAALARTLVFSPETLLMDEPFGNVDLQLKLTLQRELLSLWESERKTVVFVTHDLEEAIALSDRVVVLSPRPGRIHTILEIDLPRPRDPVSIRFEPSFQAINRRMWDLSEQIRAEHGGEA